MPSMETLNLDCNWNRPKFDIYSSVIQFAPNIADIQSKVKEMWEDTSLLEEIPMEPLDLTIKTSKDRDCIKNTHIPKLITAIDHFVSDSIYQNDDLSKRNTNRDNPRVTSEVRAEHEDYYEQNEYKDLSSSTCIYPCRKPENTTKPLLHSRDHFEPHQCAICSSSFKNAVDLERHNEEQHQEFEPYQCCICRKKFNRQDDVSNHMRIHTAETGLVSFNQIGNLQEYKNTRRSNRRHRCNVCHCYFGDLATLKNHLRSHTKELPFVCEVCDRGFSQAGNLKRHMSKHANRRNCREKPFRCQQCGQGFAHESTLKNHYRTHTGEQPFRCTWCHRAFSQIGNLKRHIAKHASQQDLLCGFCQLKFDSSSDLLQHDCPAKRRENLSKEDCRIIIPWQLGQIGGKTSNSLDSWLISKSEKDGTDLIQRYRERSGSEGDISSNSSTGSLSFAKRNWKIFPCKVCGKVYTWQHDLKIHFRIHSGEKPYSCDICGKNFAQSGAIRTHKKRHHPCDLMEEPASDRKSVILS